MKGLDESSSNTRQKTRKDVNTFINNQLKFTSSPASTAAIPPHNMKHNNLNVNSSSKKVKKTPANVQLENDLTDR